MLVEVGGKHEEPCAGVKLQMSIPYSTLQKRVLDFIPCMQREVSL